MSVYRLWLWATWGMLRWTFDPRYRQEIREAKAEGDRLVALMQASLEKMTGA